MLLNVPLVYLFIMTVVMDLICFPMQVLYAILVARFGSRPAGHWVVMQAYIGEVDVRELPILRHLVARLLLMSNRTCRLVISFAGMGVVDLQWWDQRMGQNYAAGGSVLDYIATMMKTRFRCLITT
jgi:hypothetical protein